MLENEKHTGYLVGVDHGNGAVKYDVILNQTIKNTGK